MFGVHYTAQTEEYNTQIVQSISEVQFYIHGPWLSELDGSFVLSQSC